MVDEHTSAPGGDRRQHARGGVGAWKTAITHIERNRILIRGYHVDEMMGRVSFAEAIYLLLMGDLPTPAIGKMIAAILVSSVDHGATPPSTVVARNVATTGAPLRAGVAAGVLAFGAYHGGDVEACMRMLDSGLDDIRRGSSLQDAAERLIDGCLAEGQRPPGFGHRLHTRDPRAVRLMQLAMDLELDAEHIRPDAHDRAAARIADGTAGRGHADERGRRDCRGVQRPRPRLRVRQRAVHHLPRPRPHCARP